MNFLEIDYTKPIESFGEKFAFGGEMLLLGMGTVFAVIILIMAALSVFKLFAVKGTPKANEASAPIVTESAPAVNATGTDEEIIAVIAAAIAMAESEANGAKFRVVSFKRK